MTPGDVSTLSCSVRSPIFRQSGSLRRSSLAVAAALRRQRISRQDLTARLMGDPPSGRSALAAIRGGRKTTPSASDTRMRSVLTRAPDHIEPLETDDRLTLDRAELFSWICD